MRKRRRPSIALRFDGLETRCLQAAGITPNDPLFPQQWGLSNPATGVDIEAPAAWAITTGSPSADRGRRRQHRGLRRPTPTSLSKLWTNPSPNSDPRYPALLPRLELHRQQRRPLTRRPTATGPTSPGSSPPPRTTARGSPGSPGPRRSWSSRATRVAQDAAGVRFAVSTTGPGSSTPASAYHYTVAGDTRLPRSSIDPLYQAIQYADQHGVVVVAAAGNSGTTGQHLRDRPGPGDHPGLPGELSPAQRAERGHG